MLFLCSALSAASYFCCLSICSLGPEWGLLHVGSKGFQSSEHLPPSPPLLIPTRNHTQKRTTKKKLDEIHPHLDCLRLKSSGIKEVCWMFKTLQNCTSNYRPLLLGKCVNILAINLYPTLGPYKESNGCYALHWVFVFSVCKHTWIKSIWYFI